MLPILIVDDEPRIRILLKRLLLREGFDILETQDGPSAIAVTRAFCGNIAILVTDIEMHGMSGIDLARTVTAEFPNIPVLFISAAAISEEDLRGVAPRCALLGKPFAPSDFIQALRNLLARFE